MNKKFLILSVAFFLLLGSLAVFAFQKYYNPNGVQIDTEREKPLISYVLNDLEHANKHIEKNYTQSDISVEQIYKLYHIDYKKIKNQKVTDLDSLLIDYDLDYSIYLSKDGSSSMCVVYGKDEKGTKCAVSFDNMEGARVRKVYNTFLKDKKIDDIKVIAHPSHEANKLFYITENGEKYIVPSIVDGKEKEVGLNSLQKYTPREIFENIIQTVKNQENKGID